MGTLDSHEDLDAWKLSEELKDRVFEIIVRPATARDRDFCDDLRRSARSAPANLAEGFYRFRPRDNARFVRIALGSLGETMNHLGHARKQKYITADEYAVLCRLNRRAIGASKAYVKYLDSCPLDSGRTKRSPPPLNPDPDDDESETRL